MRLPLGALVLGALAALPLAAAEPARPKSSVFQTLNNQLKLANLQQQLLPLAQAGKWAEAEAACQSFLKHNPDTAPVYYQLACTQARQEKTDQALASLARAIDFGFLQWKQIQENPDLASVRNTAAYKRLIEQAQAAIVKNPGLQAAQVVPAVPQEGVVTVAEQNTVWMPEYRIFGVAVKFPPPEKMPPITLRGGAVADNLKKWFAEGTAAGNWGDLYDNHDNGHSQMDFATFPQLTRVQYSPEARAANVHTGLQVRMLFSAVTLGNSSTALVNSPFWRSQPRAALTFDAAGAQLLALQYEKAQLYVYPEHNDYDPGHNSQGGYGDVYPANTPYLIISQGSSGSDRAFLDALATLLAAFRPETKKFLTDKGALMPTVQMLFRLSNKMVTQPGDYLTGKAHPVVFNARQLDTAAMVNRAHAMTPALVPPLVRIRMLAENLGVPGRDYSEPGSREKLFDTPSAIARMYRTRDYAKRMVVSAEDSHDLNHLPLKYHWVVLQGDAHAITIKPLNAEGSRAEITVPYFTRFPIAPGSNLESNRVDIGVFVHNGAYFSAPAFVSLNTLDCEKRVYNEQRLLKSLDMTDPAVAGNYFDPVLATPGRWRDEFQYDEQQRLLGWTRVRGNDHQDFTAEGALVTQRDDLGRPLRAKPVTYVARTPKPDALPVLEQIAGAEVLTYEYTGPHDRHGQIRGPGASGP